MAEFCCDDRRVETSVGIVNLFRLGDENLLLYVDVLRVLRRPPLPVENALIHSSPHSLDVDLLHSFQHPSIGPSTSNSLKSSPSSQSLQDAHERVLQTWRKPLSLLLVENLPLHQRDEGSEGKVRFGVGSKNCVGEVGCR